MYIQGRGHEHTGPGTSLTLFRPPNYRAPGSGMGCAGMGACGCGRCGMGLFESGTDFTQWTWKEWFAVGIGGYVLTSMFFTTKRAARQVSEGVSGGIRRTRKRLGKRIAG